MSSDLTSLVWRNPNLKKNHKFIMVAYADYCGATGQIFPSVAHLVIKTGLSESTIHRVNKDLISDSYIAKKERFHLIKGSVSQASNTYKLNFKKLIAEATPIKEPALSDWSKQVFQDGTPCQIESIPPVRLTPPPCQADTPPVSQRHPNSSANSLIKELASAQPSQEISAEQKEAAKAQLLAWQEAEALKMKGRAPRDEVEAEPMPSYQPEPTMPVAPDDAPLMQKLREAGIGDGNIRAVLRTYSDRRQIIQALDKLSVRLTKGSVKNPEALFMTIVKDPYQPPKPSKSDEEMAARRNQQAVAERKLREEAEAGDRRKAALVDNPVKAQSLIAQAKQALKQGMAQALAS